MPSLERPSEPQPGTATQRVTSPSRDLVYEPFAGSGTTLIAAEQTGRLCAAIEIDPRYAQVVIERWQTFTGRSAEKLDG